MKIVNITNYLNDFISIKPKICLMLGSGLNSFIDKLYSISDNEILIESFKDNYKKDNINKEKILTVINSD